MQSNPERVHQERQKKREMSAETRELKKRGDYEAEKQRQRENKTKCVQSFLCRSAGGQSSEHKNASEKLLQKKKSTERRDRGWTASLLSTWRETD